MGLSRRWVLLVVAVALLACGGTDPWREPDAAVEHVSSQLAEGHPEVLWQGLPASYREDIAGLIHQGAGKLDKDVWNKTFALISKAGKVLEEKREFILANPAIESQAKDRAALEQGLDSLTAVVRTVGESELGDIDKLRTLDVESFLAGTGARIFSELEKASSVAKDDSWTSGLSKLGKTRVTLISREGDEAQVRIEAPGEEPREEALVRVDERWVPREMADEWKEHMDDARGRLDSAAAAMEPSQKKALLTQLSMADGFLDQLHATKTAEEFNGQIGMVIGMLMGSMMQHGAPPQGALSPTGALPPGAAPGAMTIAPADSTGTAAPVQSFASVKEPLPPANTVEASVTETRDVGTTALPDPSSENHIPYAQACDYVGHRIRLTEKGEKNLSGKLRGCRPEALELEQSIGGAGTMAYWIPRQEIRQITLLD